MINQEKMEEQLSYEHILKALKESDQRYRAMFENMNSGVTVYQPVDDGRDFVFKDLNSAAERISRIRKEDAIGKRLLEILPNMDKVGLLTCLRRVWETGRPERIPIFHYEDEQREGWRDYFIYKLPSGEIVAVYNDITGRKDIEEELALSNRRYQSLYRMIRLMCDNVPDLIWAKDMDKRFIFTNTTMREKLLNAGDTEEPIGKNDLYFAQRERAEHPDRSDWHTFGEICRDSDTIVMSGRRPDRFDEFGNVRGEFLYLDVHKAPFFDEQGEIIGTVGCGRDVTREKQLEEESKLAQVALSHSEQLWKFALEGARDGVWDWNAETNEVFFSRQWKAMLGYEEHEIGNTLDEWDKRIHPDDKAQCYEELEKHFSGQVPFYENQHRMQCKDGTYKWILDRGKVTEWSEDGKPLRVIGTHTDISEQKRLEAELSEKTLLLEGLLDSIPDIVFFKDMDGVYLGCNPEFSRFVGRDKAKIVGHTDYDLFDKQVADDFRRNDRLMMDQGMAKHNEEWIDYPCGDRELIDTFKAPLRSKTGDLIGVLGVSRNITERKRIEESLRENRENFRVFFETMDDIILVGTPDGKIVYANPAASQKLGYGEDELKEMHILDLHPEEKRQEAERIFAEMFRGERDVCPLPLAKKDGVYLPVETRVWFGKWSGKDCIFGICKDLSKEQQALQKFNRLFNSNPAPMAVSGYPERKFAGVNDAFLSTMGYSREEVIGKTSEELGFFMEPEMLDHVAQALQDDGHVRDVELKVRRKDGTIADGLFFGEIIENQGEKSLLSVMIDITDRKRLEDQLKQAAERFKTVADFTYAWEYWIAPDGSLSYNSPSCERLTGYHTIELINNPGLIQEIVHPEDRSLVGGHLVSPNTGPAHSAEFRIISRSGETRWILHECQAVYSNDGRWLGRRVSNRDITDRKRAEESLKIASAYNRTLIETSPDALVTISGEGEITDVNTATERFTGCSRDELIGTDFSDYFTDPEKARSGYQQVFRDGTVKDYELELRHKTGQTISVLYNASVYRDESGKVAGIFAAARDVTNLKKAELKLVELNEALERKVADRTVELTNTNRQLITEIQEHADTASSLRESEKSVKMIIESSPIGIFVIQNEKYSFVNQAFMKIFGVTDSSEIIGKPPETPYSGDSRGKFNEIVRQCVNRSETISVADLMTLTQDQRERHLNLWLQPTEFWGSSAVMGFIIDVSDELELRAHLNQAQKMEALGSLAGGIAHDFNNVLFAITGYTELALSSAPADSKLNRQLEQVLGAAGRAAELVKHILTFSREREQEKKPLIIGPIVKESLNFLRASITQNIEIRRNISADLHTVNGDPTQIHQIIMNLVTNAYHAMKNTGGTLSVSLDEVDLTPDFVKARPGMLPGTYQRLMVSDTGHGMNTETLKRIFDPYFTTKEVGQGTGLGLSVVDSVVREHGGTITVKSVPDAGTTFEVYFPIIVDRKISSEETEKAAPLGKGRILFVDDETMVTEATKANLENLGYKVQTDNDPVRALARFEAEPYSFDLVITDMSMPKMTGLQLSIKISQIRKDIPIILITGFSDLLDDQSLLEYGILELIRKPIRKVILAQAISNILTKQDN